MPACVLLSSAFAADDLLSPSNSSSVNSDGVAKRSRKDSFRFELIGVRACLPALVRRVLRVSGSGLKSHCASAPVPPEPLKLLWAAVTCHRFHSINLASWPLCSAMSQDLAFLTTNPCRGYRTSFLPTDEKFQLM
jgi:hypothetical protein